jgi:predicted nucleotidyltransferase
MNEAGSKIDQLAARFGCEWPHLRRARQMSIETRAKLKQKLAPFDSEDLSIVVSGSLARNEFTLGSDIDWTLLVDGSGDPKHHDLVREIGLLVDSMAGKSTGAEGTFGSLVFSHDLIHQIGGEDDTNRNTTRRLLLFSGVRAQRTRFGPVGGASSSPLLPGLRGLCACWNLVPWDGTRRTAGWCETFCTVISSRTGGCGKIVARECHDSC